MKECIYEDSIHCVCTAQFEDKRLLCVHCQVPHKRTKISEVNGIENTQ